MDILNHLKNLKPYCLITMPRAGSEYFQSLLDGHPEICLFNLNFRFFNEYLPNSKVYNSKNGFEFSDFIDEFIGVELDRLITRYELNERQDQLGPNQNEFIKIDTQKFRNIFLKIINKHSKNKKNLFLSIYGAYHICLGRDIKKTKILFHHAHYFEEANLFKESFKDSILIFSIRDLRASFTSGIENVRKNSFRLFNYRYFNDMVIQMEPLNKSQLAKLYNDQKSFLRIYGLRLEGLPEKSCLLSLSKVLNITFNDSMKVSTWGDLEWWGDKQSIKKIKPRGVVKSRKYNGWKLVLGKIDVYIFETIYNDLLKKYGYDCKKSYLLDYIICFFLIFFPLRLELKLISPNFFFKKLKNFSLMNLYNLLLTPYFFIKTRFDLLGQLKNQLNSKWKKFNINMIN